MRIGFHREKRPAGRVFLFLATTLGLSFSAAQAATITVTTTADENELSTPNGQCSLREAITAANNDTTVDNCTAGQGADDIVFAPALAGQTILLTLPGANEDGNVSGDLDIFSGDGETPQALTITGPVEADPGGIIVDANGLDRVFHVPSGAIVPTLDITDITIQGGQTSDFAGGGVALEDEFTQATIKSVVITDNSVITAFGDAAGGGIFSLAPITLESTLISNNSVVSNGVESGAALGGGAFLTSFINSNLFTISRSAFRNNSARSINSSALGGGLHVQATLESSFAFFGIDRSEFSNNNVSGVSSLGGGINIDYAFAQLLGFISNSTISGNLAFDPDNPNAPNTSGFGGGIYLDGFSNPPSEIRLDSVTVVDNRAAAAGEGSAAGGGLYDFSTGQFTLANTIVARNIAPAAPDCFEASGDTGSVVNSEGFNLIGNVTNCNFLSMTGDLTGDAEVPLDPRLDVLASNGGATRVHALLNDSPARDAGNPLAPGTSEASNTCSPFDQIDQVRPVDGDNSGTAECDIGAFEAPPLGSNQPPSVIASIPDQSLPIGGGSVSIDLNGVFSDPEGDTLLFEADSDNPDVVLASVQDNLLILEPGEAGVALVTVFAFDSAGQSATVRVKQIAGSGSSTAAAGGSGEVIGGGSGGGCALGHQSDRADPLLWLLAGLAMLSVVRRRRTGTVQSPI